MKKSILFTFVLCLLSQWSVAQAHKWVEKAKRSVFSIVTYDKDDKIQNTGNGLIPKERKCRLNVFWEPMICMIS